MWQNDGKLLAALLASKESIDAQRLLCEVLSSDGLIFDEADGDLEVEGSLVRRQANAAAERDGRELRDPRAEY